MKTQYPIAYGAYSLDDKNILNSSSGGIFGEIVNWFTQTYKGNYKVCGVVWDDDFKGVHHVLSSQAVIIDQMRASKYVQSKKGKIYNEIKILLDKGTYILFTGCPCEVAGLKNFLKKDYENLYTVDFMCKGSLSPTVLAEYIDIQQKKVNSKIVGINMRYKWKELDMWIPQFIRIDYDNGRNTIEESYNTKVGHAFRIMQRSSCYECPYIESNKMSDFTMGDFHGVKESMLFYNSKGTSAIFVNTKKGDVIFNGIKCNLRYDVADANYIFMCNRGFKDPCRDVFSATFAKEGLEMALNRCLTAKDKIKMILPTKFVRSITSLKRKV